MELQYLKSLEENNLKVSDLPEDAQVGITNINEVLKGVKMLEKQGKPISEKVQKKIKALDKWVCYEILDHLEGTDKNDDDAPEVDEVLEEIDETKKGTKTATPPKKTEPKKVVKTATKVVASTDGVETLEATNVGDPKGLKIDADLKVAYDSGKKTITLEELKTISKTAYDVIFDAYDESGDNGVETSNYTLLETEENVFTLTQK